MEQSYFAKIIAHARTICIISALVLSIALVGLLSAQLAFTLSLAASIVLFNIVAISSALFICSLIVQAVYVQKFLKLADPELQEAQLPQDFLGEEGEFLAVEPLSVTQSVMALERLTSQEEKYLDCYLNCAALYSHLEPKRVDERASQVMMKDFAFVSSKIYDLMARLESGQPLASAKDLGSMFFPRFVNPLTHPLLGIVYRLNNIFLTQGSGSMWLSRVLKDPLYIRESNTHLLLAGEDFIFWNLFFTGWCLSSESDRQVVVTTISELGLNPEACQQVINYLDQGNVVGAIMHATQCRQLPPIFISSNHVFLNAVDEGWGPVCYRASQPLLEGVGGVLVAFRDFMTQLAAALPSSWLSLSSQLKKGSDSPIQKITEEITDYMQQQADVLQHPYALTSLFVFMLIWCRQQPKLLIKIRKFLPNKAGATLIQLLSTLAKGMLASGVLTNKHLQDLARVSGLSELEIAKKIQSDGLVSLFMSKIL